jgi:hypothetical protein
MSSNYGTTWTQTNAPTSNWWYSITCSSGGQYAYACILGGGLYMSSNYGATWTITTASSPLNWSSVACSGSGQYVYACNNIGVFISQNYGASWTQTTISSTKPIFNTIITTTSGQYVIGNVFGSDVYISTNYGISWTMMPSVSSYGCIATTMSSSGQYVYVSDSYNIYNYSFTTDIGNIYGSMLLELQLSQGYQNTVSVTTPAPTSTDPISTDPISTDPITTEVIPFPFPFPL